MTKGKGFSVLVVLLTLTMLAAFAATAAAAPALYNLRIMTAGDKPPDQQSVFDAIEAKTRNTLNVKITVDYIPWGDYIEKVRLMSAAKEKFDICLTFSGVASEAFNRQEMIPLDDLLKQYGQNLSKKILPSNWVWAKSADGKTIAVPCQYAKDGIYTTLVVRKDLRVKYKLPEITNMDTLGRYLDAVAKNEPKITPLLGGSIQAAVVHELERLYDPVIDYGYQGQGYFIGFWETKGADAYKVKNWYADKRAQTWIKMGADAMNRGWYAKDLNAGIQGYDQTAIASGLVACLQMDYYNFNTIYNNAKQTNPSFELEWALINKGQPVPAETCNNFSQVSATSGDPARAVMFLDWIQASQDNYDLWYYGIKGKHYTLSSKGDVVYPAGSISTALPYAPTPWYFRNYMMDRAISTDCDMSKTAQEYWKNVKVLPLPSTAAFVFQTKDFELEITQLNTIIAQYWNDLSNGVLQGDANYQKFLKELDNAGMPASLAGMQKQLDAWRAAHK